MWAKSGDRYKFYEKSDEVEKLPPAIYTLHYGPFGSMYLEKIQDRFEFGYKLYGMDGFPERVIKAFDATNTNLGVMLCGLKGTGKTVQAEQICNLSNLPVILVGSDFNKGEDLVYFLGTVDQEVVVLIDEYEKIFGKSDALLSIMDGVLNGSHRRLFVLTANTMHVADALIDRPSRILYMKKFSNLDVAVIGEVVDDMLGEDVLQYRNQVVDYLAILEIVTIDIVKTVVKEVNLFKEPPQGFKDILNVTMYIKDRWTVCDEEGNELIRYGMSDLIDPFVLHYDLRFKEFGDIYKNFGYITKANKKAGKITTTKGTYIVRKAPSYTETIGAGVNPITFMKSQPKVMIAAAGSEDDE